MRNPWLVHYRRDDARPTLRLVCFPHAGGGPSTYGGWAEKLDRRIAVSAVLLPGREIRLREPPCQSIEHIVGPLTAALAEEVQPPWVLFGHSFGSVLAFEVARQATARGWPPQALMVSGRRAPHLGNRRPLLHRLGAEDLLQALGHLDGTPQLVLRDPDLMSMFLPSLRADLTLNETYAPLAGTMLACPIHAFMGREDTEVNETELLAWREVTSGPFEHRIFHGNHFYLKPQVDALLSEIERRLRLEGGGGPCLLPEEP